MVTRSYLALLSLSLATCFLHSDALSTGTFNKTFAEREHVSKLTSDYDLAYGNTNYQLSGDQLGGAASSGNSTMQDLTRRDVWSPKITSPDAQTVWVVGETVKVSWDTSDPPKQITNTNGKLLLGHVDDGSDEHLDVDHPLAEGFDLHQGSVQITVPHVGPGNDYIVVLIGDSGNKSPSFSIN